MAGFLAYLGFDYAYLVEIAKIYWVIPLGMLALYFYGRFHFNTPDYALGSTISTNDLNSDADIPASRISGMIPPIITTSRSRFNKYSLRYTLILQSVFLAVAFVPDLVAYAANLVEIKVTLSNSVQHRAVWSLFALTGLLSAFPPFKDVDAWILKQLHTSAAIPHAAERMARKINNAPFIPDPAVYRDVVSGLVTNSVKCVAAGLCSGSLEDRWLKLRCVHDALNQHVFSDAHTINLRFIANDHAVFGSDFNKLRSKLTEFFINQDKLLRLSADSRANIDDFYMNISDDEQSYSSIVVMREKRSAFEEEVKALTLKACRLIALAAFASYTKPEDMSLRLFKIGFQVEIRRPPAWNWDAITRIAFLVFLSILVPSCIYGYIVQNPGIDIPSRFAAYVPTSINQALYWAVSGSVLQIASIVTAIKLKRFFVHRLQEGHKEHQAETIIVISICYVISLAINGCLVLAYGVPIINAFYWAVLPTISGAYVVKYINRSRRGRLPSRFRALKQSALMGGVTLIICLATMTEGFSINNNPLFIWVYTAYAVATVSLMGWTIGFFFQVLYSHSQIRRYADAQDQVSTTDGESVVGDFIVRSA